tara:strand:+ start:321 stop:572 length:252 start_codon:yes stop_codon:yes gene_type:complete
MERNKTKIADRFKDESREDLEVQVLSLRARLRIEKSQSSWLDRLADELRDDEESTESDELYKEYNELTARLTKEYKENYGIEL